MRTDTPKLRSDITFTVREKLGDVIVADEALGQYHSVGELEHALFIEMNGEQTLTQIARRISRKYDGELRPETVKQLVDAAADLGLLDLVSDEKADGENAEPLLRVLERKLAREDLSLQSLRAFPEAAPTFENAIAHLEARRISAAARALHACQEIAPRDPTPKKLLQLLVASSVESRRPEQSFWSYRVPLLAPDRFLKAADDKVGWLVNPLTAGVIVLGLGCASLALLSFFDDFSREMGIIRNHAARFSWLILPVLLANQLSTITHELSHGLVCRHYGGSVRRIGLLFRTVLFGAYCDVSSAYTFQERWKRAAVTAAGPLHDALLFSLTILATVLTAPGTSVHQFALLFMISWGTGFFFRLLPFNKDDLYFTISEAFNATNLLEKAGSTVKSFLARALLGVDEPPPDLHPRERRVVIIYGTINLLFTAWLFGRTLYFGLGFAIENLRGFGAVVLFLILYFVVGARLRKLGHYLWSKRGELLRSRRFLLNSTVGGAALLALPFLPMAHDEVFECQVVQETVPVQARAAGTIVSMPLEEGDAVEQGTVLAVLESRQLQTALSACEAEVQIAQANLTLAQAPPRDVELAPLLAAASRSRQTQRHEQSQLERVRDLSAKGMVNFAEVSDELERAEASDADSSATAWALREAKAGKTSAELGGLEAQLRATMARCEAVELERKGLELRSPGAGRVLSKRGGRGSRQEGVTVASGELLMTLALSTPPRVELKVPPDEADTWVTAGKHVQVRLAGDPRAYDATLTSIAPRGAGAVVDAVAQLNQPLNRWVHQASCRAQFSDGRELVFEMLTRKVRPVFQVSFWTLW